MTTRQVHVYGPKSFYNPQQLIIIPWYEIDTNKFLRCRDSFWHWLLYLNNSTAFHPHCELRKTRSIGSTPYSTWHSNFTFAIYADGTTCKYLEKIHRNNCISKSHLRRLWTAEVRNWTKFHITLSFMVKQQFETDETSAQTLSIPSVSERL